MWAHPKLQRTQKCFTYTWQTYVHCKSSEQELREPSCAWRPHTTLLLLHPLSSQAIHTVIFNSPPRSHTGVVSRWCRQKRVGGLGGEGRNTNHSGLRTPHSVHRILRYDRQGCIWGKGYSPSGNTHNIYICTYINRYLTLAILLTLTENMARDELKNT